MGHLRRYKEYLDFSTVLEVEISKVFRLQMIRNKNNELSSLSIVIIDQLEISAEPLGKICVLCNTLNCRFKKKAKVLQLC